MAKKESKQYHDEPVPLGKLSKDRAGWPPDNIDLNEAWVIAVIVGGANQQTKHKRWPAVFKAKGFQSNYEHKGQAAKGLSEQDHMYHYKVIFGKHCMYGDEGAKLNLPAEPAMEGRTQSLSYSVRSRATTTIQMTQK